MARMKQVGERFEKEGITRVLYFDNTAQSLLLTSIKEGGEMGEGRHRRKTRLLRVESDSDLLDEIQVCLDV